MLEKPQVGPGDLQFGLRLGDVLVPRADVGELPGLALVLHFGPGDLQSRSGRIQALPTDALAVGATGDPL